MQLIEPSLLGLRSARHVLKSPKFASTVTLFPMVHAGEASFYQDVYQNAALHDLVLLEGIPSKRARALTRSYRSLPFRRLGLIEQPKLDVSTASGKAQHADISAEAFDALWREIPLKSKVLLQVMSMAFAVGVAPFMTRSRLARHLSLDVLVSRDDILGYDDSVFSAMDRIDAARDSVLCAKLEDVVRTRADQPFSIAVIFGAKHMQRVVRHLQEFGDYAPAESTWMTVFET